MRKGNTGMGVPGLMQLQKIIVVGDYYPVFLFGKRKMVNIRCHTVAHLHTANSIYPPGPKPFHYSFADMLVSIELKLCHLFDMLSGGKGIFS